MGMGFGAGYADVVEEDFIKKICPKEFKAFKTELDKADNGQSEYFDAVALFEQEEYKSILEDIEEGTLHPLCRAYNALITAFEKKTKLDLTLCYHDSDSEGDRYDEVDGYYWSVGGVWQRTDAGKKYQDKISRKFFVTFG